VKNGVLRVDTAIYDECRSFRVATACYFGMSAETPTLGMSRRCMDRGEFYCAMMYELKSQHRLKWCLTLI